MVYRVARGFDAFAPPDWAFAREDGTFGNRFDDPGAYRGIPEENRFRVLYCAAQPAGAFGETIARYRRSPGLLARLQQIETDEPPDPELEGGVVPEDFRLKRISGATRLSDTLLFADFMDGETLTILGEELAQWLASQKAEAAVWDAVSALLTDPKSLKSDLEAMIEREKETRSDPERAEKALATTLVEAERKREKYQEMYAADAMTLEELRSRLDALEETRESARGELAALASWRESLQALERDKELLLQSYATRAPEALDSLGPEERRTVYSMLGLRVDALSDKSLRISGAFGEESLVCHHDRTSTR